MMRIRGTGPTIATIRGVVALSLVVSAASAQGKRPPSKRPAAPKPTAPAEIAKPQTIEVTVVEVAGGWAYLQPGAKAGVHRSAVVVINHKEYKVVQTSDSYAVLDLGGDTLHEKDKGRAGFVAEEAEKPVELPPPRAVAIWEHAWDPEQPPALSQETPFVPLGGPERDRRWDVRLAASGGGLIPLGGQVGSSLAMGEIDARVHAEPFRVPLAFDFDGAVQEWAAADLGARVGGSTRPTVWVREALASYGSGSWYAGIGRMKYAASTLGTLDGARVQMPLGQGFSIGAFGGLLPNPLSGQLASDAQRFGVEAKYNRPDFALRPEGALVLQGSTFGGSLDERRVSGMFGIYPGLSRLGGHFEVSNFDSNNPWKASAIELTAAGLDTSVRFGVFDFGARADLLQPERSKWLASYLPTSWFCTTVPAPGATPTKTEPCDGSVSTRALGSLDAGLSIDKLSLMVGATAIGDLTASTGAEHMIEGFATGRVVRIAKYFRLEVSGNYGVGSYLNMFGGMAGPGLTLFNGALDLSAYYRLAELEYASASSAALQQDGFGGTVALFPNSTVMFTAQGEAITGNDVRAVFLFGTMVWRPRL
jgi:hypothetical protein